MKKRFLGSVMFHITLSLSSIIAIAIMTMFASYWITEQADIDAYAINVGGSLRMQTYQIGFYTNTGLTDEAEKATLLFEKKLDSPIFSQLRQSTDVISVLNDLKLFWYEELKPNLSQNNPLLTQHLATQVLLANKMVTLLQNNAEHRIVLLRTIQLVAVFITLILGVLIFYLMKLWIQTPMAQLTQAAHAIGKGDFTQRVHVKGDDELALLAATLNHTCDAIAAMYGQLEKRVQEQTQELKRNNKALLFLFSTVRTMLEKQGHKIDYQKLLDQLTELINIQNIELCLMTAHGETPYLHLHNQQMKDHLCVAKNCNICFGDAVFTNIEKPDNTLYPLVYNNINYGVLVVSNDQTMSTHSWQNQLVQSVADQIALSLNLADQHNKERRIALLQERTVIARELHDSLAQALSYLKIQVTRLDFSQKKLQYDQQQPIIDELRLGLDSAYRQLRELLTTFRLKVLDEGLYPALNKTLELLTEQSDMHFSLNFAIQQVPLSPMEEIHLLQIAREACQNTVHHSQGRNVWIDVKQTHTNTVVLTISDDGIGITKTAKLNHYGMAIMQERAKQLNGELNISDRLGGGTEVMLTFTPQNSTAQ
ncbi:ATP-binding protein [Shewanella aestuarii]|uniref:Sensor protein n=1 Tax=Shewanella aestuarii TaxID=1028752 RepID=A0A6G9QP98_9GAMM|nr:ATP-binding protein [Shewanella aestuarii]QIR16414.1 HAMP domain-containing protein [Shewanella aestuarii]